MESVLQFVIFGFLWFGIVSVLSVGVSRRLPLSHTPNTS